MCLKHWKPTDIMLTTFNKLLAHSMRVRTELTALWDVFFHKNLFFPFSPLPRAFLVGISALGLPLCVSDTSTYLKTFVSSDLKSTERIFFFLLSKFFIAFLEHQIFGNQFFTKISQSTTFKTSEPKSTASKTYFCGLANICAHLFDTLAKIDFSLFRLKKKISSKKPWF